jgi:GNAT superfamily N-acetyltransferase
MAAVAPRVAGPADLDPVVEALTTAFLADPVWGAYSFPDPGRQVEQSMRFWAALAGPAMRFPWTMVTPGCEAVAVWIPPGEPELTPEQAEAFAALAGELLGPEQAGVVLDAFDRLDAAHPHDPPHYYLSLLATHNDHRGNGLGMALLAACLEQVDAEHAPAYLESTNPANNLRYMRHGFEPFAEVTLPNGHIIETMWREPR